MKLFKHLSLIAIASLSLSLGAMENLGMKSLGNTEQEADQKFDQGKYGKMANFTLGTATLGWGSYFVGTALRNDYLEYWQHSRRSGYPDARLNVYETLVLAGCVSVALSTVGLSLASKIFDPKLSTQKRLKSLACVGVGALPVLVLGFHALAK